MTPPSSEDMPTPACWDEIRGGVAFLVAPAMVPLYLSIAGAEAGTVVFASVFSYIATWVIGVPIYVVLLAWNLTAFWVAPVIGIVAGAGSASWVPAYVLRDAPAFGAVAGALVAMMLWTIGRPDRRA